MEADLTQDPVAEADEAQPSPSEESASPSDPTAEANAMNAMLRGLVNPDPASKPDGDQDGDDSTSAQDGASDPTGTVKPSEQPAPGRRGAAAEIARLKAENERLQQAYDAANPPSPDPSDEARAKAVETETRFRRLLMKPDNDLDWTQDDVDFLVGEKEKRAKVPELTQQYEASLDANAKAWQEWAEQSVAHRWNAVKAELSSTLTLPGVTDEVKARLLTAPLSEQILIHRQLEREAADAEITKLRNDLSAARRDLYGATRAPMNGGRSSPGRTVNENDYMNSMLRGGRS